MTRLLTLLLLALVLSGCTPGRTARDFAFDSWQADAGAGKHGKGAGR